MSTSDPAILTIRIGFVLLLNCGQHLTHAAALPYSPKVMYIQYNYSIIPWYLI